MAAVDLLLNDVAALLPDPVPIQQPFAASNSYFVPKSATSPVWKIGFRCRKDQDYKRDGAFVFCTHVDCKNSARLPTGHKNEFPLHKKWKTGDSNQIMLIHCRGEHKAELDAMNSQVVASVAKAASNQPDVRTMLVRNSVVIFDEAKQRELNKAIVYNLVVHDKLPLSRFNSAGFRRSFELVSDGKFKLARRPGGLLDTPPPNTLPSSPGLAFPVPGLARAPTRGIACHPTHQPSPTLRVP
jgi:hypothetical protein